MKRILLVFAFAMFTFAASAQVSKLYRYSNSSTWAHFYTTSWDELGNGKYNFKFEIVTGFVFTKQVEGSAPMHRYFNTSRKTHFFTMSWDELGKGNGEYKYEGVAYYAFGVQVPGSVPLYRYHHANNKAHFYTTNFNELGEGKGGYVKEGIAGYIFPDEATAMAAIKAQPQTVSAPIKDEKAPVDAPVAPASSVKNSSDFYITVEGGETFTNFDPNWRTALMNAVVAVWNRNQPMMLLMLPANGSHSPVPGEYEFVEGSKRAVKKGSQQAKLEFEPGFVSAGGGKLTITEHDEIFTFAAEEVSVTNSKTKETKKISFRISMFIQKQ